MPPFRPMSTYQDIARRPAHHRWTGERARSFLLQLGEHGSVARAARAVGMSRKSCYALRDRAPEFAKAWQIALHDARLMRDVAQIRRKAAHPLLDKRPVPTSAMQGDKSGPKG